MEQSERLPRGICNRVVDNLRGDRRTLTQCALVCRGWLPRSRLRLFQDVHIHLRSASDCDELVALCFDNIAGCRPIAEYPRHVSITLPFADSMHVQTEKYTNLQVVLWQLPNLESVLLRSICSAEVLFDRDLSDALISILKTKKSPALTIGCTFAFNNIPGLMHLVASLPNLRSLELVDVSVDEMSFPEFVEGFDAPYNKLSYSLTNLAIEADTVRNKAGLVVPLLRLQHQFRLSTLHLVIHSLERLDRPPNEGCEVIVLRKFFQASCLVLLEDVSLCYYESTSTRMGLGKVEMEFKGKEHYCVRRF